MTIKDTVTIKEYEKKKLFIQVLQDFCNGLMISRKDKDRIITTEHDKGVERIADDGEPAHKINQKYEGLDKDFNNFIKENILKYKVKE